MVHLSKLVTCDITECTVVIHLFDMALLLLCAYINKARRDDGHTECVTMEHPGGGPVLDRQLFKSSTRLRPTAKHTFVTKDCGVSAHLNFKQLKLSRDG